MTVTTPATWADPTAIGERIYSGGWIEAGGGLLDVIEPATGDLIAHVGSASPEDVRRAAARAAEAQREWAGTPFPHRAAVLSRAADLLRAHEADFGHWLRREAGATALRVRMELGGSEAELREGAASTSQAHGEFYPTLKAGERSYAYRVPRGVIGVISPWNAPLLLAMRSIAPALALGNAVVVKPDPHTPISGGVLIAQLFEDAGLPTGLLHVVPGGVEAGEALVADPHIAMISFTGSTQVGRLVGAAAGQALKPVNLELGGNNAFIVLDDADVEAAASAGAWSTFFGAGQGCICAGRHLVAENLYDRYVELVTEYARALTVGDTLREESIRLGPLINQRQAGNVNRIVTSSVAAGARLTAGGEPRGCLFPATVLADVTPNMAIFEEETFGPVVGITSFRDDDEAVALANQSEYGLTAAVHSRSTGRALAIAERLNTGMAHINDVTIKDGPTVPFGGTGASGNGGRFGGSSNWDEFTEWRWFTVNDTTSRMEL
ncbi:aldehyde dehydrogenase family protein [Streptomyces sp. NBC_00258]|uniref:aldehyde dehydrogenase family protein n=1 Tax=Streptomyces sp. NBC_00258 TaxID=2903642 RepID=UPI002E2CC933|nr:aldehyde dehydrogenase family protein [Streptomyces sp. NBC_00258]